MKSIKHRGGWGTNPCVGLVKQKSVGHLMSSSCDYRDLPDSPVVESSLCFAVLSPSPPLNSIYSPTHTATPSALITTCPPAETSRLPAFSLESHALKSTFHFQARGFCFWFTICPSAKSSSSSEKLSLGFRMEKILLEVSPPGR